MCEQHAAACDSDQACASGAGAWAFARPCVALTGCNAYLPLAAREQARSLCHVDTLRTLSHIAAAHVRACSEFHLRRFLTGALEEVSQQSGLGQAFLGLIILPIAGNACEHITAVFVACKNKMDLAIGVALGSSIQVRRRLFAACALQMRCLLWSSGQTCAHKEHARPQSLCCACSHCMCA